MKQVALDATIRKGTGKSVTRKLRRHGRVPGILYGHGKDPVMLEVEAKNLQQILSGAGSHAFVNLKVAANGGAAQEHLAMIAEVQRDVFQKNLYHVDFKAISIDEKVVTTVKLQFHGQSLGEKEGGIVEHVRREVEIEALPMQVPSHLTLEMTNLQLGHALHAKDLTLPEGVRLVTGPDEILAVVHVPRAVEEAAPAAAAAEGAAAPAAGAAAAAAPAAAAPAAASEKK